MSTNQYNPQSRNPADNDTLIGLLMLAFEKFLQNTDDMLPAEVIAFNAQTNSVQVQPLISVVGTTGQIVPRAQIASLPVMRFSSGGFVDYFPINRGDFGWVKANDRDISLFKQNYSVSRPNTQRKHSFEDGVFIPQAAWNEIEIASEDVANRVIQNYTGTVKIALWEDLIKILAPAGVGIGGTPNPSLILDLQSTTQAFAPPRMTTGERNAIPNPQEGFTIYNTTTHGLETYTNTGWP